MICILVILTSSDICILTVSVEIWSWSQSCFNLRYPNPHTEIQVYKAYNVHHTAVMEDI